MKLEINPNAKTRWNEVGSFGTRIMVIDDFILNAAELREYAVELDYFLPSPSSYYGGTVTAVKASIALDGENQMVRWIADQMLDNMFPAGGRMPYITTESLRTTSIFAAAAIDATTNPADCVDQHVDPTNWLACILHLSLYPEERGTAFWRNVPTGFESWTPWDIVTVMRVEQALGLRFTEQLQQAMRTTPIFTCAMAETLFAHLPGTKAHSKQSSDRWELLEYIPAKFNRMVVFPTWQFHSIVDETDFTELTTDNMRLTLNNMIPFPVPASVTSAAVDAPTAVVEAQTAKPGETPPPAARTRSTAYRKIAGLNVVAPPSPTQSPRMPTP